MTVLARARVPFARLGVQDPNAELNFQALERFTTGMFAPTMLVFARSPYTIKATDWLILCDCTAGAITLTFPDAGRVDGLPIVVLKTDSSANAVTLTGTFSGIANPTLALQYQTATIEAGNGVYYLANPVTYYAEGAPYTATLTCGTSGAITLNSGQNTLRYTRIGRIVNVTGDILVSSVASPVGTVALNLPFAVGGGTAGTTSASVIALSLDATFTGVPLLYGQTGSSAALLGEYAGGTTGFATAGKIKAGTELIVGITYSV